MSTHYRSQPWLPPASRPRAAHTARDPDRVQDLHADRTVSPFGQHHHTTCAPTPRRPDLHAIADHDHLPHCTVVHLRSPTSQSPRLEVELCSACHCFTHSSAPLVIPHLGRVLFLLPPMRKTPMRAISSNTEPHAPSPPEATAWCGPAIRCHLLLHRKPMGIHPNFAGCLPMDCLVRPPPEPALTSMSIAPAPCSSPARRPPPSTATSGYHRLPCRP
jgi:hypothetical protein